MNWLMVTEHRLSLHSISLKYSIVLIVVVSVMIFVLWHLFFVSTQVESFFY